MGGAPSKAAGTPTQSHRPSNGSFRRINDCYSSLEQVTEALRREGLESSNLIVAVDFTKSNEWTGKHSNGGRSLHSLLGPEPNPYESALQIIGSTLSCYDDDNLIPAYGFGDASCQDSRVFSFNAGDEPCRGMEAVLWRYRQLVPAVRLAGPTSFAPAIRRACQITAESGGQFHILLLIADGQVTRSSDLPAYALSPQEAETVEALVAASSLPLAVVMVGVGDGPWDLMHSFDDALPQRSFDNFQFVNYSEIMARHPGSSPGRRQAAFALAALMEVPEQFKTIQRLGLLGRAGQPPRSPPPLPPPDINSPMHASAGGLTQHQQASAISAGAPSAGGLYPSVSVDGAGLAAAEGGFFGVPPGWSTHQHQQQQQGPGGSSQPNPLSNPMFMCPITADIMADPVIAADGYTYDRHAIQAWLAGRDTSPMTNEVLPHTQLIPNHALRSAIMEAQQQRQQQPPSW